MKSVAADHAIHVLCNVNDAYVTYCGVMLTSLLCNLHVAGRRKYAAANTIFTVIHVISHDISEQSKCRLQRLEELYPCKFNFIVPTESTLANLPQSINGWPISTYLRLIASDLLPPDVKRVIYLDSDVAVDTSILPLWEIDLEGNAIGAVNDTPQTVDNIDHVGHLGIKDKYFNSGVLVIDVVKFRELDLARRSIEMLCNEADKLAFPDQDILNILLDGKRLELPMTWNVQSSHFQNFGGATPAIRKVVGDIWHGRVHGIIHYTGVYKPWLNGMNDFHPLEHIWRHYHRMSPWADVPLTGTERSLSKRLIRWRHALAFRFGLPSAYYCRWDNLNHKALQRGTPAGA